MTSDDPQGKYRNLFRSLYFRWDSPDRRVDQARCGWDNRHVAKCSQERVHSHHFSDADESDDPHCRSAVKRIVITSSTGAVREIVPENRTFSEVDWNNKVVKELEEQGRDAPFMIKYQASKVFAEKGDIYRFTV